MNTIDVTYDIGINEPVPAAPQTPFGGMKESGRGHKLRQERLGTKDIALQNQE